MGIDKRKDNVVNKSKNIILNTISDDAFFRVNKAIVHKVGHVPAILLADLISKYRYFLGTERICEDDSFYNTSQMIEADTCITAKQRRSCQKKLEDIGFLKVVKRGMPATNFYYIGWDNIQRCLSEFKPVKYEKMTRAKAKEIREKAKETKEKTRLSRQKVTTSYQQNVVTGDDQNGTLIRNKNKTPNENQNIAVGKLDSSKPKLKVLPLKEKSIYSQTVEILFKGYQKLHNGQKPKFINTDGALVKQVIKLSDNDIELIKGKCRALYDKIENKEFIKGEGFQVGTLISNWNSLVAVNKKPKPEILDNQAFDPKFSPGGF